MKNIALVSLYCLLLMGCASSQAGGPEWQEKRVKEIKESYDNALISREEYEKLMDEVDAKVERDSKK